MSIGLFSPVSANERLFGDVRSAMRAHQNHLSLWRQLFLP